ncbi:MAG: DISARM system helicase DrmA [Polyangiaceae bacterium]
MSVTAAQVRAEIAAALPLDLVGPPPGHPLEEETLEDPPSRFYLTGFLAPRGASEEQRSDPTAQEELALGAAAGAGGDDDETPEKPAARRAFFPSSIGVSVLVAKGEEGLDAVVSWGDYRGERTGRETGRPPGKEGESAKGREKWKRAPHQERLRIDLKKHRDSIDVPGSEGLRVVVRVRGLPEKVRRMSAATEGARVVSVFFVNERQPAEESAKRDTAFAFQACLSLSATLGFVRRPNLRGQGSDEWDEQVADLQYRDQGEHAVGHGVATHAEVGADGVCRRVSTACIPRAEVEKVVPGDVPEGTSLSMDVLGDDAATPEKAAAGLGPIVEAYGQWITDEGKKDVGDEKRAEVAVELLRRAEGVRRRIADGIEILSGGGAAFEAFRLANKAMAMQARQRDPERYKSNGPVWRPFQLAFVLLNLRSIVTPTHADRETVDLLFFPTGGGKTEAYLGLATFTLLYRRLTNPGLTSAGVSVLMRYTLRLLTLDQLERASTLVCALELLREKAQDKLGKWPFEIGLWVGMGATPNRIGRKGDNDARSARSKTIAYQNNDKRRSSPIPLERCPWCKRQFEPTSFVLLAGGKPNADRPTDLRVTCARRGCEFSAQKGRPLPIVAVDEPIYRRLPCFLIATVDKFAALPWVGQTGALFGRVDRADGEGFYGAADPQRGRPIGKRLLPPDLVIQDELHLISGPLGTMVGLYETALDALSTRHEGEAAIRPKVIASTATVRRAEKQIHALFARREVEIFPPQGPTLGDSFFAKTAPRRDPDNPAPGSRNARMYLGVAAPGRSLKVVLLRTYLALLGAAERAYRAAGGDDNPKNPADPYATLVGYFNSLRELGGSRRIVEDEVQARLLDYGRRKRDGEARGLFDSRRIAYDVVELTSRESTAKVAEAKRRLDLPFSNPERVDVALATNMISVGLDIPRLGLLVALGQPKTTSEYIQATSRVGRDDEKPGLVLTLFNAHRPRDRSCYERFEAFHASFYRAVEATSVTPFSPRAIDRGLSGVAIALARLGAPALTPAKGAVRIAEAGVREEANRAADVLGARFVAHDPERSADEAEDRRQSLRKQVADLFDAWSHIAGEQAEEGAGLQYQREEGGPPPLLRDPLEPETDARFRKMRAHRSLRDVEPSVNLWVQTPDGKDVPAGDEVES